MHEDQEAEVAGKIARAQGYSSNTLAFQAFQTNFHRLYRKQIEVLKSNQIQRYRQAHQSLWDEINYGSSNGIIDKDTAMYLIKACQVVKGEGQLLLWSNSTNKTGPM